MRLGLPLVRRPMLVLALACTASCSSTTDSGEPKTTHPSGVISDTLASAVDPHPYAGVRLTIDRYAQNFNEEPGARGGWQVSVIGCVYGCLMPVAGGQ